MRSILVILGVLVASGCGWDAERADRGDAREQVARAVLAYAQAHGGFDGAGYVQTPGFLLHLDGTPATFPESTRTCRKEGCSWWLLRWETSTTSLLCVRSRGPERPPRPGFEACDRLWWTQQVGVWRISAAASVSIN